MTRKLNFEPLEHPEDILDDDETAVPVMPQRRWPRRQQNPKVQMSLRMNEDVYDRFRSLCVSERRTNGGMLEVMMSAYMKKS